MDDLATAEADTLDLDDVIAELNAEEEQPAADAGGEPEGAEDATDAQPEETEEEAQASDEVEADPEEDTEDDESTDEEDPQEVATLDPPARWDADKKELFAKLDPDVAAYVVEREKQQQAEITRRQQEAADLRKQIESGVTQQDEQLAQTLAYARTQFGSRYEGITPQSLAEHARQGPEQAAEATQIQLAMQADQAALMQLEQANSQREAQEFQAYVAQQSELLPELAPDLADPEQGPARKAELAKFLQEGGFQPEQIKRIGAAEMSLAYDAMRYRALKDKKAAAKPAAKKVGKVTKSAPAKTGSNKVAKLAKARANMKTEDDLIGVIGMGLDAELDALGF